MHKLRNRLNWWRYRYIFVFVPKLFTFYALHVEGVLSKLLCVNSSKIRKRLQQPSKLSVVEADYFHVVVAPLNPIMRFIYWHVLRHVMGSNWMNRTVLTTRIVQYLRMGVVV